jgi:hypothetical protein
LVSVQQCVGRAAENYVPTTSQELADKPTTTSGFIPARKPGIDSECGFGLGQEGGETRGDGLNQSGLGQETAEMVWIRVPFTGLRKKNAISRSVKDRSLGRSDF